MAAPDYATELTLVNEAIAAVLKRKGVKWMAIRGRQLQNMNLKELTDFRSEIMRAQETVNNPFGYVHGVAQKQAGP